MSSNNKFPALLAATRRLLVLLIALALMAPATAPTPLAIPAAEIGDGKILLQFKAGNHLLGFASQQIYFAAIDHLASFEFVGANLVTPQANAHPSPTAQAGAAELGEVVYRNLWKGIDASFAADPGSIAKATYTVARGADPASIHLRYNAPVAVLEDGSLRFEYESGALLESPPIAWQKVGGQRVMVEVAFRVLGEQEVGFQVGQYNNRLPLVIDPVYQWHTFYGVAQTSRPQPSRSIRKGTCISQAL